ncbi:MAG: thiamine-phosphate kinase [Dysgonamonadaceae bacterium]|jgi:thiamine-monophosphate kinase|nr:thiamine-phosphate kinase [Dysgonamonadaceae bacterium]
MDISELGKFGLLSHLTGHLQSSNPSTIQGVGEDAAVLDYKGQAILLAHNLLLEGIHFDLTYVALKFAGYKAATTCFSDIYAMNGQPRQLSVSVGISKRFSVEDVDELWMGIEYACERYGVDLVGVNTSSSLTGLCIGVTVTGEANRDAIVYRNTAKVTDLICVSGDLGSAYMGLQLLEREKAVHSGEADFTPDFAGKEYLLERQLRPEARKDIVELLAQNRILPTSMMDISDGLASELLHICKQSNVGCAIYEERLPIDYQTAMMAEQFNMNLTTVALNGGDDYELLFTVPLHLHETIQAINGIRLIGHIVEPEEGAHLIARDGTRIPLIAQGWTSENNNATNPTNHTTHE